jgi:hypothetical protein
MSETSKLLLIWLQLRNSYICYNVRTRHYQFVSEKVLIVVPFAFLLHFGFVLATV